MTEANQLLRSYAEGGSEGAFRELVNRYLDFVYSVALHRANGASQIAEEIAQTVFCDLAREAQNRNSRLLEADCALGGWLHRHACFVAANFLRAEQRRETRERIAAEMNSLETMGESAWQHLAPEIDEAINELGAEDRTALVLRFYEQRDLRAIGAALGVSEDAAQKRVCRGLEKLRGLLAGRGIGVSVGLLSVCLEEELLTAAPAGLAVTTSHVALAGVSATPGVVGPGGNPGGLAKAKGKLLAGAVGLGLLVLPEQNRR